MKNALRTAGIVSMMSLVAVFGVSAPASAGEQDPAEDPSTRTVVPIDIVGYDESVAEANGFTIVTYPDGSQESVPVTPEAIALASEWEDAPLARGPKVTVQGNCGSSWIKIDNGAFDVKRIETGYDVKAPVANRIKWAVQIQSIGGLPTVNWPVGPSGASWWGAANFSTANLPGWAYVTSNSSVVLITGAVCSSGSPATGY